VHGRDATSSAEQKSRENCLASANAECFRSVDEVFIDISRCISVKAASCFAHDYFEERFELDPDSVEVDYKGIKYRYTLCFHFYEQEIDYRPQDFDEWETVDGEFVKSFSSFPIHVTLAQIRHLLEDDLLGFDSSSLKAFFVDQQVNFCQRTLMLDEDECLNSQLSGCKLDGVCEAGTHCINDESSFKGYKCCE